jgi:hypothetical protein
MTPPTHRLQTELQRLFGTQPETEGCVRTLVLGLSGPADWPALATVWRGVQADLNWPAPAIAVNGVDAFELWLPLLVAVPLSDARRVLQTLCARYLSDVAPARWRLWPALDEGLAAPPQAQPQLHAATGRWSAFVAPDLAAVFGDDPSLDVPPGDDAQADVLSRIQHVKPADWQRMLAQLAADTHLPALRANHALVAQATHGVGLQQMPRSEASPSYPDAHDEPRRFLLNVMNDPTVEMALRIEAAKALMR